MSKVAQGGQNPSGVNPNAGSPNHDDDDLNIGLGGNEDDDDDDGAGGMGYVPDAQAQTWHNEQVKGLKRKNSQTLGKLKTAQSRADTAEARVAELEAEISSLLAAAGVDASDMPNRLKKLADFEADALRDAGVNEDELLERGRRGAEAKYERMLTQKDREIGKLTETNGKLQKKVDKYEYDGRIQSASIGVIHSKYKKPGEATLKSLIRKNEDGELECFDENGDLAVDDDGNPQTVEDFVKITFPEMYPDLCVRDTSQITNGAPGTTTPKTKNPWMKETRNRTLQATMVKNKPTQARQMMKAAGVDPKVIRRVLGS